MMQIRLANPADARAIADLFVHPEQTGLGIGTRLLETVKIEAREKCCSRVALNNWRDKASYQRGFYQARGFLEKPLSGRFVWEVEGLG